MTSNVNGAAEEYFIEDLSGFCSVWFSHSRTEVNLNFGCDRFFSILFVTLILFILFMIYATLGW